MFSRYLIIGAGPAGLHLAKQLLKHSAGSCAIDIAEASYLAGGLLRYGVAPDHPEVKSAFNIYDSLFENDKVNFFSSLELNPSLVIDHNLFDSYSSIIMANGVDRAREVTYEGEEKAEGCIANANDIVSFYNSKPATHDWLTSTQVQNLERAKRIIIVGNGNVSLDLARVLSSPADRLSQFAFEPSFLSLLGKMDLQSISVVARRGVVESAFDLKELRELNDTKNMKVGILKSEFEKSMNLESLKKTDVKADISNRANARKAKYCQGLVVDQLLDEKLVALRYYLEPSIVVEAKGSKFLRCKRKQTDGKVLDNEFEDLSFDFLIKSLGYTNTKHSLYSSVSGKLGESNTDNLLSVGWANTGGKGKLNDSYVNCDMAVERLLAQGKTLKLFSRSENVLASLLGGDVKSSNNKYLKLREKELKLGSEVKDLSLIKEIMLG